VIAESFVAKSGLADRYLDIDVDRGRVVILRVVKWRAVLADGRYRHGTSSHTGNWMRSSALLRHWITFRGLLPLTAAFAKKIELLLHFFVTKMRWKGTLCLVFKTHSVWKLPMPSIKLTLSLDKFSSSSSASANCGVNSIYTSIRF